MTLKAAYDKKTLDALRRSVEKWEKVAHECAEEQGHTDCPLCLLFHPRHIDDDAFVPHCQGCPIRDDVDDGLCHGTPYEIWTNRTTRRDRRARTDEQIEAAVEMLDYLKDLLKRIIGRKQ